jgi:hypothetical protein
MMKNNGAGRKEAPGTGRVNPGNPETAISTTPRNAVLMQRLSPKKPVFT